MLKTPNNSTTKHAIYTKFYGGSVKITQTQK